MEKKYQVFISSTYEDLKSERDQAIKAILELGHIPVGMEMFSAADEHQWELIKRQIEQSDYYVLILAHRYGSETLDKISYTEKEFNYAVSCGVPTLSFVIDPTAPWPQAQVDSSSNIKKLDKFKAKVKNKLVHFWKNKDDLHGKISISFVKAITRTPRVGWIRATETISIDVTNELSRLSNENASLRSKVEKLTNLNEMNQDEVKKVVKIMTLNQREIGVRKEVSWDSSESHKLSLLEIFLSVAENLILENSSNEIAKNLALHLIGVKYYHNWPVGRNIITSLIADFVALEVIEPSKKKHSVNDEKKYWSLTKTGKEVLKRARRIQLEQGQTNDFTDGSNVDESESD